MSTFKRYVLLVLFSALVLLSAETAFSSDAQPLIRESADRRIVLVGDRIRFNVEVSYSNGEEIEFPGFKDGKIGDFEIKESGLKLPSGIFGRRSQVKWYYVAAYDIGKLEIPPIEIKYKKLGAKEWSLVKSSKFPIEVRSILTSNASDIKDIKGPLGFFEINWLLVSVIIIMLAAMAIFIIKKMRRKAPLRLPHETALEELEKALPLSKTS